MSGQEVEVRTAAGALAVDPGQSFWTDEQRAALRQIGIDEASNGDLAVFLNYAQRTALDPFSRQIYMIGRNEKQRDGSWGKKWTIQASIDGLRIIAQRSGDYAGQVGPEWCGQDGFWHDVWLKAEPPAASRVGVLRTGFAAPLYAVAMFREYVGTDKDGNPTKMWRDKGALMIAKCAEALALRKAFPNDLSGIYTSEEMSQADTLPPATGPVVSGVVEDAAIVGVDGFPEWQTFVDDATTRDELRGVWNRFAGQIDTPGRARLSHAMTVRAEEISTATDSGAGAGEATDSTDLPAESASAPAPDNDMHVSATRSDLTRLSIRLGELGIKDRQDCLDYCGAAIGRVIKSRTEMTRDEAARAISKAAYDLGEDVAAPAGAA